MDNIEPNVETWQVEAGGNIYDTSFDEMKVWIAEGSLLRIDRVRKGNLRWIEAGKVPTLIDFFNAKDASEPVAPVITTTNTEILGVSESTREFVNAPPPVTTHVGELCSVHGDAPAAYLCETCTNFFCKACPTSYGSSVKICPFCGAMCNSVAKVVETRQETQKLSHSTTQGFGFADLGNAFAHPFKFKVSLFLGALMFALFSFGQGATGFGGIFMMSKSIFCFMLANMLTFGVLGNVADSFSQGNLDENFMPSFDDFNIWDDVVHPFFLSIGVYISSFGPLLLVGLIAVFMVAGTVKSGFDGVKTDAARTINPGLPLAANAAQQSERVREIIGKDANQQQRRVEAIEAGEAPDEDLLERSAVKDADAFNGDTEAMVADANETIDQYRKAQAESIIGKAPETRDQEQAAMLQQILGYGILFLVLGALALLWGLFYFPAACTVAGYTRSFTATVNPLVGIDTIKHLGTDYLKLLAMGFVIVVMSGVISTVLATIFNAFDLPSVGNLPATFIGAFFTFYFSVVFSCLIGYMLFKAADRLELYSRSI